MFRSVGSFGAFAGEADVPYVTSDGKSGTAHLTPAVNCSDPIGLQQALNDLGFPVPVTGFIGDKTRAALTQFAQSVGADYNPKLGNPKGSICDSVISAWQAKQAAKAQPAPETKRAETPTMDMMTLLSSAAGRRFAETISFPKILTLSEKKEGAGAGAGAGAGEQPTPQGWWEQQSVGAKIAMGVGALAVVGGILWFALGSSEPKKATPNRRRRRRAKANGCGYGRKAHKNLRRGKPAKGKVKAKAKPRVTRKITTGLPKTCRTRRPKGYPVKRSKYALPECMMYPLRTRAEVRNAASRFGKYGKRYSPEVRAKIAHRIDRAKRRFGIGEYRSR